MDADYATLLAQVIPVVGLALIVVGLALIVEMRELEQRLTATGGDTESSPRRVAPQIMAGLSFVAMAALTLSEISALMVVSGRPVPRIVELIIFPSLVFAVAVTFLLPPALWTFRVIHARSRIAIIIRAVVIPGISILVTLTAAVILFLSYGLTLAMAEDPAYRSGDRPTERRSDAGCLTSEGCTPDDLIFYQWDLDPRTRPAVMTTFEDERLLESFNLDHERVGGTLQLISDNQCLGGKVEWTVRVDGSKPLMGILDSNQRGAPFEVAIVKHPEHVTILARRIDNQPCGVGSVGLSRI